MPRTRAGHTIGDWLELAELVPPEVMADSPLIERTHGELQGFVAEIRELIVQRDYYEARKQETTQRIQEILPEGRRTATLLRLALKQHFGPRSEQLAAFGIQPFRGRKRSRKAGSAPSPETLEHSGGDSRSGGDRE